MAGGGGDFYSSNASTESAAFVLHLCYSSGALSKAFPCSTPPSASLSFPSFLFGVPLCGRLSLLWAQPICICPWP